MIVNLFAGPGGWCEALRLLGRTDGVGIEFDAAACETRAAAGHLSIRADVRSYPAERFAGAEGLIASPPCPQFSSAGSRLGALLMAELEAATVDALEGRATLARHTRAMARKLRAHLLTTTKATRAEASEKAWRSAREAALSVQPARWAFAIRPRFIAMEQVPAVLPLFKAYARALRSLGFSAVAVELNAADFGVPQTRRRAFLLALAGAPVNAPAPSHTRGGAASLFGQLEPWVSMAEALGWGMTERPALTTTGVRSDLAGGSYARRVYREAVAVRRLRGAQPNRRAYDADEPAPAIAFGHDAANWCWRERFVRGEPIDPSWPMDRPATTVAGDPRIAQPGHKVESTTPDAPGRMEGAIRIEAWEAGVLQSFPPDYPWQGTKTKQFEQIGNAVPPVLGAAVLAQLLP